MNRLSIRDILTTSTQPDRCEWGMAIIIAFISTILFLYAVDSFIRYPALTILFCLIILLGVSITITAKMLIALLCG